MPQDHAAGGDVVIAGPEIDPAAPQSYTVADGTGVASFLTGGTRWTDNSVSSGQVSSTLGASGGVVAWSIAGSGLGNASGYADWFTGVTTNLSSFLSFDYTAELRAAFAAWSAVADIQFIQVPDGGGNMGSGPFPTIRIGAGAMDGDSGTLAQTFFPSSSAVGGDMMFDSGEVGFWTADSFRLVAIHELGHALGLDHENAATAVMNPYYDPALTGLQADDIAGIRSLYGTQDFSANTYYLPAVQTSLTLLYGAPSLTVMGNSSGNSITGSANAEAINGAGGGDAINGGGGIDALTGGIGADRFIFAASALPSGLTVNYDVISDFNRPGGTFSASENDVLDVSALTSAALAGGQSAGALVRAVMNQTSAFAEVQVDADGTANGIIWTTVARVTGMHQSESATALVGSSSTTTLNYMANAGIAGDFNGDGKSDILWRNDNNGLALWTMNGATILGGPGIASSPGAAWHIVAIADFSGDAKSDILWRNDSGALAVWTMNGATVLTGAGIGSTPDASWNVAGTGDFDGDGKADILWRNDSGALALWTMNGGTILSGPGIASSPGSAWHVSGIGDFSGDGKSDILWRHDNGGLAVWVMNGSTITSGAGIASSPDLTWHIAGVNDFSGDGKSDILWRNDSGSLAMWQMNGASITAGPGIASSPGSSWTVASTGDFSGDAKADILWRNQSGQLALWTMNGATVTSGPGIASAPDQTWKIATHNYEFV